MKNLGSSVYYNVAYITILFHVLNLSHISLICAAGREKKLLVSSEDYGRDLTGVQNLRKKHKRLEAELGAHEPAIQVRSCTSLWHDVIREVLAVVVSRYSMLVLSSLCSTRGRSCLMTTPSDRTRSSRGWRSLSSTGRS